MNLAGYVREGALGMGIGMSVEQSERFAAYHALLTAANARFNLTRVPDDPREAADRNYLDCIAPLAGPWPPVRTLIDVGSGAGFPGVPLAILRPDVHVVLLDALDKRVRFLREVIAALELNAEAVHLRAEEAARLPELRERFDLATARAVAPVNVLAELLLPFVRPGGHMLALKGPALAGEMEEARGALALLSGEVERTAAVTIPGRDWAHTAVWIRKTGPVDAKYPRKPGIPGKRPLKGIE